MCKTLYTSKLITGQSSAWGAGRKRMSGTHCSPCSMQDSPPSLPGPNTCRLSSRTLTERTMNASFLSIPNGARISTSSYIRPKRWQDTWNTVRPSHGIAMNGKTPLEKRGSNKTMIHSHVFTCPVLLMEDVIKMFGIVIRWF